MLDDGGRKLSELPTNSLAGSLERIEVYRHRWWSGEAIFHPHDNTHMKPDCFFHVERLPGIRFIAVDFENKPLAS